MERTIKAAVQKFVSQFLGADIPAVEKDDTCRWRCKNFRLLKGGFFSLSESMEMASEYEANWRNAAEDYLLEKAESNEPVITDHNFDLSLVPQLLKQKDEEGSSLANLRIEVAAGKDTPARVEKMLENRDYMPEYGLFLTSAEGKEKNEIILFGVYGKEGDVPLCAFSRKDEKMGEKIARLFSGISSGEKKLKDVMLECAEEMFRLDNGGE